MLLTILRVGGVTSHSESAHDDTEDDRRRLRFDTEDGEIIGRGNRADRSDCQSQESADVKARLRGGF